MGYNYDEAKKAYESLTKEQQQQFVERNKNNANVQQFAKDYVKDKSSSGNTGSRYNLVDSSALHDTYVNNSSSSQLNAKWGTGTSTNVSNANNTYGYTGSSSSSTRSLSSGGSSTLSTRSLAGTVSSPYVNQGTGTYRYSPVSGYYEKVVNKGSNTSNVYGEDENHYGILDDKNKIAPDTTYSWKGDSDITNSLQNSQLQTNQTAPNTNTDLTGGEKNPNMNNWGDFNSAVNSTLQKAFGLQDLNALKEKYPEQYPSLVQALENISGTWNALDPSQRQLLEGQLQAIIGTAVGAGSDTSQLNVLSESILAKFKNPDNVKQFVADVTRLKTEGLTTAEIAKQMGVDEDMVQQGIFAANGLDNKLGEYFELTDKASKDITEPYDTKMERLEEEKRIALERQNQQIERLKEDFDKSMERQKQANDMNAHNAAFLSSMTGSGFSQRGMEGLNYVQQQAQNIIDDMVANYDRSNWEMSNGVADILRNWQRENEDLTKAMQDALTNAKNNYITNELILQQQYGTVGMQAQQQMANNVQDFITQVENIYDNGLERQQKNLTNLITNFSNLNALSYSNLTLRNAQIQQFQNESMNLNRSQLQGLAQQLGMDSASFQDLVNYQAQAVANTLNGYVPGAGVQFQNQIQSLLDSGYTPNQAISSILNSADFKAMQQVAGGSNEYAISGNYLYNKKTGDWQQLGSDDNWAISGDYKINKSTGETVKLDGSSMGGGNYVMSETVNGQTYGVSQQTYNGLVNFYSKFADENGNIKTGAKGGQCGAFVNDYLQSLGLDRVFVDPIDKKIAAKNTPDGYTGQVGDVIIMDSPSKPENGHVAIIIGKNEDGTYTTLESNRKNNDGLVFSRTIDPNKTKIYGYYHPDGTGTPDNSIQHQYDIDTATMRIGKMAYGSNISNDESERVRRTLENGGMLNKSQTDILYDILGMTITNNKDKAEPLVNIMIENADENGLKGYDTVGFANLINSGKIDLAVAKVEKAVAEKQKIGKDFIDNEASALAMYDKGNRAIELINDNLNKLGIVAGNWNKQKSKFLKNENFQQLDSALTALVADWRHEMAGSAVTETELKMIESLLPSVKDNPYNAIQKIQELQNNVLSRYNSQRGALDLPYVDQETLKDKTLRSQLYYGGYTQGRGGAVAGEGMGTSGGRKS